MSADVRVMVLVDTLAAGGTEISTMAALPLLRRRGIDVQVAVLRSHMHDRGEREVADVQVPTLDLGVTLTDGVLGAVRAVRTVLRAEGPDLLHASLFSPVVSGSLAAIGTGIPVLASVVNTPPRTGAATGPETAGPPWKVRASTTFEARVLRHLATHVHAVTPGVRDSVVDELGIPARRVTVAERGRDPERFALVDTAARASARAALGLTDDDEVVVALGRQEPQKGFVDLVEATARLGVGRPRLRVLIAGREGAATAAIRERVRVTGTEATITLLGDRPDPERILAAADVYVLSSRREGASGATIEAMGMGIPVVATDVQGLDGITVDGENARVVPVGDAAALAGGLGAVLEDDGLAARLGAAGHRTFLDRFTLERSADALAELYRTLARPRP